MATSQMIKDLLANGAHFGHPTNKWNPKMEKFIFGEKSGIYIIDLEKTEKALQEACDFVGKLAKENRTVLFVGTKRQAQNIVKQEAERCGMFYVEERWLGGCLTNFQTIRKSVDKLNDIQKMKEGEIYDSLAKKEQAQIDRQENKLLRNLGGIRDMVKLPDCVVIVDTEAEGISVKEAVIKDIPIVAILDTNSDPDQIDFPVPANDDAIRSIRYILSSLADAIIAGSGGTIKKKSAVSEEDVEEQEKKPEEQQEEELSEEKEKIEIEEVPEKADSEGEEEEELSKEEEKMVIEEAPEKADSEGEEEEQQEEEKKEQDAPDPESGAEEEQKTRQDTEDAPDPVEGDIKLD